MAEKKSTIDQIDRNFKVEQEIGERDVCFHDVRNVPFALYGLYNPLEEPVFKRLPDEIAEQVNEGVKSLYLHTAGGRVRFSTDSKYVAIRVKMSKGYVRFPHMPLTGGSGFDLYVDDPETKASRFCRAFIPPIDAKDGYVSKIVFPNRKTRYFTINFPNYNPVDSLEIGLQEDAKIDSGMQYSDALPIVYYGSSITQGGCASRPGNAYANVISRRLNMDFINLGFSGSGKGEDVIVDYMASLPMSVFVCDYDHNAPNAEHLEKTHLKLYQKIRAKHPTIPFIMVSKPDFNNSINSLSGNNQRRRVILDTYHYALANGDTNVYFIDGEGIFRGPYEDMCTVDGCHPNDLGFALMADSIGETIRRTFLFRHIFD